MSILIGIDASRANKIKKTGTEWYSYHLIQELKKITSQYGDAGFVLYSAEPLRGDLGILPPNWESRVLAWPPKRFWTQIRLSWEMWRHPPDILFVPAHTIPVIHPKKVVTTVHDLGFINFPKAYGWLEKVYHKFALNFAVKKATKIITVSEFTKKELVKHTKIIPEKVAVIYNSHDSERYKIISDKSAIEKVLEKYIRDFPLCKRGIKGDFFKQTNPSLTLPLQKGEGCRISASYLLYIGRLEAKKNTPGLFQAFSILKNKHESLRDLKLVLVGSRGFGYEEVEKEIEGRGLQREIILPGWVDEEDLPFLLSGAELFVFPSFYEGFGIPILEAMALGTPVLASDIPVLREISGEAVNFFNPNSPEEMAEGIYKILSDDKLKNYMREMGLMQAQKFSWEKCARETMEALKIDNKF